MYWYQLQADQQAMNNSVMAFYPQNAEFSKSVMDWISFDGASADYDPISSGRKAM